MPFDSYYDTILEEGKKGAIFTDFLVILTLRHGLGPRIPACSQIDIPMQIDYNEINLQQPAFGSQKGQRVKYGVVIVTCNRKKLLSECLDCVLNQTLPFAHIIVVDNHSTDGSGEYLDALAGQQKALKVFHMKENLGGAGGFAVGIKKILETCCDWFLIIDDDAMIEKTYMEKLARAVRGTDYLACSGTVMTEGRIDGLHRRRITNPCLMFFKPVEEKEYEKDTFTYDISTFCGLCIKTSLAKKAGLPRADYFIWFDDAEYCLRFRRHTSILNVNHAILNHKTQPSKSASVCWKHYYGLRNAIDIGKRYSTHPRMYLFYIYMNHTAHILIDSILLLLGSPGEDIRYRRQIYTDVLKGIRRQKLGKDSRYLPGSNSPAAP